MATTQKIVDAGGTTTSFSNTPQAQDDILNYTEESVVLGSLSTSIILDVMQNDLGGNAKTLFSIDDGTFRFDSYQAAGPNRSGQRRLSDQRRFEVGGHRRRNPHPDQ